MSELEACLSTDTKMGLLYVAGYVIRNDMESQDDTFMYHEKYGDFTDNLNRGGLKIPGDSVCQWTFYSYIMFHEVVNDTCRTYRYVII